MEKQQVLKTKTRIFSLFRDLFNSQFVLSSKRNEWIDYARGICIILVCYRHCYAGVKLSGMNTGAYPILKILNVCFFSFRMPFFFLISGLFFSRSLLKKTVFDYISGRFQILFYPLLVWGSIQITIQLALSGYVNASRTPADYLYLITLPRKVEHFWYLNALFCVGALYALLKAKLRFNVVHQLSFGAFLYFLSFYLKYHHILWGFLNDVFFYYIFFGIGDLISNILLKKETENTILKPRWLSISLVLFVITQTIYSIYQLPIDNVEHHDTEIPFAVNALFIIAALSGILFVIQCSVLLKKINAGHWVRIIGYHSLYIYLAHLIVMAGVRIILLKVFHVDSVPLVLIVASTIGIIVPVVFYNLVVRLGGWLLFTLKKPVEEIEFYQKQIVKN